jgi:GT2 family glycosyltransferase
MAQTHVLIGSPVCQKPAILEKFLLSLNRLDREGLSLDFYFVDDNQIQESSEKLRAFEPGDSAVIISMGANNTLNYMTSDFTHFWTPNLIERVAEYKNGIIQYAMKQGYDYLFLIDSDLLITPGLIQHLISLNKEIVSEIFWTKWYPANSPEPNAWMYDAYEMASPKLSPDERTQKSREFLESLKVPGVYEVGGLGACTLLSAAALHKGCNFSPIKNISIWGEDRWFCIRAAALGIPLFADTHYPAYHIYRESDLANAENFLDETEKDDKAVNL